MGKGRMEAFSDGMLAVIITVMVLEMKVPQDADLEALAPVLPVFLVYVLSFIYLAIYWNNHHHLLHSVERISGPAMWANLHLLFWLSLIPFVTGWMGENHYAALPTAVYGAVLLAAALAWQPLQRTLIAANGGAQSKLAHGAARFQGQGVRRVLRRRHRAGVRQSVDCGRTLRTGGGHVADTRPAYRAGVVRMRLSASNWPVCVPVLCRRPLAMP